MAFFLACCSDDPVVVSVGSQKLKLSQIHDMVPEWDSWDDSMRLSFLSRWIDEETVYQEAIARGIDKDENLIRQVELTRRKMVVDYFLQSFADTIKLSDAEKMNFYKTHRENYVRGSYLVSGGIFHFKSAEDADAYYARHKGKTYATLPDPDSLVELTERFDSVENPDNCLIPVPKQAQLRTLSSPKKCGGVVKMYVVTNRLDSAEVLSYEDVKNDVENEVWVIQKAKVMEELKNQWKNDRSIFSSAEVFSKKGEQ